MLRILSGNKIGRMSAHNCTPPSQSQQLVLLIRHGRGEFFLYSLSLFHIAELVPFVVASLVRAEPTNSSVCFLFLRCFPVSWSRRLLNIYVPNRNKYHFPLELETEKVILLLYIYYK